MTDLEKIMSTRVRIQWPYRINFERVGNSNWEKMEKWCEENCRGRWRSHTSHLLYFQFTDERDVFLFKLRWAAADGNELR